MTDKFYKTGRNIIFILLLAFAIYGLIIEPMIGFHLMNKKSKYAISDGRLNRTAGSRGMGSVLTYEFTVNGKIYRGSTNIGGLLEYHYYFVRFYPNNPNYNSIEKKEAFWYDIKIMPPSGFDSMPRH